LEKDAQVRLTANDAVSSAWIQMDGTGEASDVEKDFLQFQSVDSSLSRQLVYGEADRKPRVSITGADVGAASDSFQKFAPKYSSATASTTASGSEGVMPFESFNQESEEPSPAGEHETEDVLLEYQYQLPVPPPKPAQWKYKMPSFRFPRLMLPATRTSK